MENHAIELRLIDCIFHVNENGRRRVISNRRKNVHAWIKGEFYEIGEQSIGGEYSELWYDPYFTTGFFVIENGLIAAKAESVIFKDNRCYAKGISYEPNTDSVI